MAIQTRESTLTIAKGYVANHECPYAERLVRIADASSFGSRGLEAYRLSYFVEELQALHSDNECPPTHTSPISPTHEWADWVQDTAA